MSQEKWEKKARAMVAEAEKNGTNTAWEDPIDQIKRELAIRDMMKDPDNILWHRDHIEALLRVIEVSRMSHLTMAVIGKGGCVSIDLPDTEAEIAMLVDLYGQGAADLADAISKSGAGCGHSICVLRSIYASLSEIIEDDLAHGDNRNAVRH